MDKVPNKYKTVCSDIQNGSVIFDRVYEAINIDEAETRAFLNCVKEGNKSENITVSAEKLQL